MDAEGTRFLRGIADDERRIQGYIDEACGAGKKAKKAIRIDATQRAFDDLKTHLNQLWKINGLQDPFEAWFDLQKTMYQHVAQSFLRHKFTNALAPKSSR